MTEKLQLETERKRIETPSGMSRNQFKKQQRAQVWKERKLINKESKKKSKKLAEKPKTFVFNK